MGYRTVTLGSGQICDYLYVSRINSFDENNFVYVDSEPHEWQEGTVLLSNFNHNLVGGNSALTSSIIGYEVRKRKGAQSYSDYVTTISETTGDAPKMIIDYAATSNTEYIYYLYPTSEHSGNGVQLSPLMTKSVSTKWNCWTLLVVDETEENNVFYLNKMFKFRLNLETGDINNNASVTVTPNFTPYPTVQHGYSNYWSGNLTSLCGIVACPTHNYIQTVKMIEELKALTTDNHRKFLKDMDGNIWEVDITDSIVITTNDRTPQRIKTVRVSWTEIASASKVSIINNPNIPLEDWILTETGENIPYIDYVWDDYKNWDNSYYWTENESTNK